MLCEIILLTGSVYLLASGICGCFRHQIDFMLDSTDINAVQQPNQDGESDSDDEMTDGMRGLVKDYLKKEIRRQLFFILEVRPHLPDEECAICIGQEGDFKRVLPCGHAFCETCLFEWFEKGAFRCPLCNTTVKTI